MVETGHVPTRQPDLYPRRVLEAGHGEAHGRMQHPNMPPHHRAGDVHAGPPPGGAPRRVMHPGMVGPPAPQPPHYQQRMLQQQKGGGMQQLTRAEAERLQHQLAAERLQQQREAELRAAGIDPRRRPIDPRGMNAGRGVDPRDPRMMDPRDPRGMDPRAGGGDPRGMAMNPRDPRQGGQQPAPDARMGDPRGVVLDPRAQQQPHQQLPVPGGGPPHRGGGPPPGPGAAPAEAADIGASSRQRPSARQLTEGQHQQIDRAAAAAGNRQDPRQDTRMAPEQLALQDQLKQLGVKTTPGDTKSDAAMMKALARDVPDLWDALVTQMNGQGRTVEGGSVVGAGKGKAPAGGGGNERGGNGGVGGGGGGVTAPTTAQVPVRGGTEISIPPAAVVSGTAEGAAPPGGTAEMKRTRPQVLARPPPNGEAPQIADKNVSILPPPTPKGGYLSGEQMQDFLIQHPDLLQAALANPQVLKSFMDPAHEHDMGAILAEVNHRHKQKKLPPSMIGVAPAGALERNSPPTTRQLSSSQQRRRTPESSVLVHAPTNDAAHQHHVGLIPAANGGHHRSLNSSRQEHQLGLTHSNLSSVPSLRSPPAPAAGPPPPENNGVVLSMFPGGEDGANGPTQDGAPPHRASVTGILEKLHDPATGKAEIELLRVKAKDLGLNMVERAAESRLAEIAKEELLAAGRGENGGAGAEGGEQEQSSTQPAGGTKPAAAQFQFQ